MTRDPRLAPATSLDDESIGFLVRDVADGWTMPAIRLDAPSWRDRVRGRRTRWFDSARAGLGRAGRAATAAVALTVIGALAAVIITRPPQQPAGTPKPTAGATSAVAVPTPLPNLVRSGDVPFPSRILVANEEGDISLVDLANGTIGGSIARAQWPSAMTVTSAGLVVCVCITTSDPVDGYPTRFDVRLRSFTRTTTPIRDDEVTVLEGTPDPRSPATPLNHVVTSVAFSPDDHYAFVGWSVRDGLAWHGGVLIVDIGAGSVTGRLEFPDMTAGESGARRLVSAPALLGLGEDGTLYVSRPWAEWGSANVDAEPIRIGDDAFTARLADGDGSAVAPFPEAANCGPRFLRAGARPGGGAWVTCLSQLGTLTLRRVDADWNDLGSESMPRTGFVDGDTTTVSPDGGTFYAWDPGSSTLTRIDLATGVRDDEQLAGAAAAVDPVTAFGRWLAPPAEAKSILRGAILVSPDGARLYVLAARPGDDALAPGGSDGILVVDAATLRVVDRWPPAADLMSIALSPDGRLLYAAGLPGVNASGEQSLAQGASVTVYDTATGVQRLIAGQLGMGMLMFPGPIVP